MIVSRSVWGHGEMFLNAPAFLKEHLNINSSLALLQLVHWRNNIFLVPSGKVGKAGIRELVRLYQAYTDASTRECIALKACTILQCLLLQKPHAKTSL